MTTRRHQLPIHALAPIFGPAAESLSTSLGEISKRMYYGTVRNFLRFLSSQYPHIGRLEQLQRDPHLLSWLTGLRSHNPPLSNSTHAQLVMRLRRLFDELAWTQQLPALAHLLIPDDVPRTHHYLPRPLTPEQDQLIQTELLRRNDLPSTVLLLQRHTGMRIGECADLSLDCLRPLGPDQWAIHVPLGKLKTERWVPVDSFGCQLVARLRALRAHDTPPKVKGFLVSPALSRQTLIRDLRATLHQVAAVVGINTRIVPHQFRHTYATEMLRAGVSLPAVMKLLGHTTPTMTMLYVDITQTDLQREFQLARSHPRHLVPPPRVPVPVTAPHANLAGLLASLRASQHVLEMWRRGTSDDATRRLLTRLENRLMKMIAQIRRAS
jgi:site-specific recombinase XerD